MSEFKPLYRYTLQNANEFDEVEQWRESHRENCKCANDITDAINSNYHDNRLDDCVKPLLDKYGLKVCSAPSVTVSLNPFLWTTAVYLSAMKKRNCWE